ncbi:MAG: hypothetical protein KA794_10420 [Candidatus Obscuribacter sp.]|nr:hypothetical protein [Candidatus Obscuribacter sp.]
MTAQIDEQKLIDDELDAELAAELQNLAKTLAAKSPESQVMDFSPITADQKSFLSTSELNAIKASDVKATEGDGDADGWRIARQAMVREFMVFSTRTLVGLALVGIVGMLLFVCIKKVSAIDPKSVITFASQIFPVLKQVPVQSETAQVEPVKVEATSTTVNRPRKIASRPRKNTKKRQIAQAAGRRGGSGYYFGSDAPTGGDITYSDGTLTEYTWH